MSALFKVTGHPYCRQSRCRVLNGTYQSSWICGCKKYELVAIFLLFSSTYNINKPSFVLYVLWVCLIHMHACYERISTYGWWQKAGFVFFYLMPILCALQKSLLLFNNNNILSLLIKYNINEEKTKWHSGR